MRELGAPDSGTDVHRELIEALTAKYQVLHVDYPRGTGESTGPLPGGPHTRNGGEGLRGGGRRRRRGPVRRHWATHGARGFGIHVASRTRRCAGLAIGGWPVLDAPYAEILEGSRAQSTSLPAGTAVQKVLGSNTSFYAAIVGSDWDEEAAVEFMRDRAGLLYLYVGSEDVGVPAMGLELPIAEPIVANRERLEAVGWEVDVIEGYDHMNLPLDAWLPGVLEFLEGKTW